MKTFILTTVAILLVNIMIILPVAINLANVQLDAQGIVLLEIVYLGGIFAIYSIVQTTKVNRQIKEENKFCIFKVELDKDGYPIYTKKYLKTYKGRNRFRDNKFLLCNHYNMQERGCLNCTKRFIVQESVELTNLTR